MEQILTVKRLVKSFWSVCSVLDVRVVFKMLLSVGKSRCSTLPTVNGLFMRHLIISVISELTSGSFVFLMKRAIAKGVTLASIEATNCWSTWSTVMSVSMVRVPIWLWAFCIIICKRPSVSWGKCCTSMCCWFSLDNSSQKLFFCLKGSFAHFSCW